MALTDEQISRLAERLLGTGQNVYGLSLAVHGEEFRDEDWARLEAIGGIFKCDECNQWLPVSAKCADVGDSLCEECVNGIDAL